MIKRPQEQILDLKSSAPVGSDVLRALANGANWGETPSNRARPGDYLAISAHPGSAEDPYEPNWAAIPEVVWEARSGPEPEGSI